MPPRKIPSHFFELDNTAPAGSGFTRQFELVIGGRDNAVAGVGGLAAGNQLSLSGETGLPFRPDLFAIPNPEVKLPPEQQLLVNMLYLEEIYDPASKRDTVAYKLQQAMFIVAQAAGLSEEQTSSAINKRIKSAVEKDDDQGIKFTAARDYDSLKTLNNAFTQLKNPSTREEFTETNPSGLWADKDLTELIWNSVKIAYGLVGVSPQKTSKNPILWVARKYINALQDGYLKDFIKYKKPGNGASRSVKTGFDHRMSTLINSAWHDWAGILPAGTEPYDPSRQDGVQDFERLREFFGANGIPEEFAQSD